MFVYYMTAGINTATPEKFPNDKEAWESLRLEFGDDYVTLYRKLVMTLPINCRKLYKEEWNCDFSGHKGLPYDKNYLWLPILRGIASHKWGFEETILALPKVEFVKEKI